MQNLPPPSPSSLIARVLGLAVGLVVLAGAAVIGTVVLAVVIGLAFVAGLAFYLRIRWLQRQARKGGGPRRPTGGGRPQGETIEGEYRVESGQPERPREHQR